MSTKLEQLHFLSVVTATPPDETVTRGQTRSLAIARPVARTLTQSVLHRKDVPIAFLLLERKPNSNYRDIPFEKLVSDAFFRMLNQRSNQLPSLRLMEAIEECDQVVREVYQKERWRDSVAEEITFIGGVFSVEELIIARIGRFPVYLYRSGQIHSLFPESIPHPLIQPAQLGRLFPSKVETVRLTPNAKDRLLVLNYSVTQSQERFDIIPSFLLESNSVITTHAEWLSERKSRSLIFLEVSPEITAHQGNSNARLPDFKKQLGVPAPILHPGIPPELYRVNSSIADLPDIRLGNSEVVIKSAVASQPRSSRGNLNHGGYLVWSNPCIATGENIALLAVADGISTPDLPGSGTGSYDGFIASTLALEVLFEELTSLPGRMVDPTTIERAFQTAHQQILKFNARVGTSIATSLTALVISGKFIQIGHVGKTSAIIIRNEDIDSRQIPLTRPHTLAGLAQRKGLEIPEDQRNRADRILVNVVGHSHRSPDGSGDLPLAVELSDFEWRTGDRLVVSTFDTELFTLPEISAARTPLEFADICRRLTREGVPDDLAMVVADFTTFSI